MRKRKQLVEPEGGEAGAPGRIPSGEARAGPGDRGRVDTPPPGTRGANGRGAQDRPAAPRGVRWVGGGETKWGSMSCGHSWGESG